MTYDIPPSSTGTCCICGRPRPKGYSVTCGGSYCSEARYHEGRARNARKGSRAQKEALAAANRAIEKALDVADRRAGR